MLETLLQTVLFAHAHRFSPLHSSNSLDYDANNVNWHKVRALPDCAAGMPNSPVQPALLVRQCFCGAAAVVVAFVQ